MNKPNKDGGIAMKADAGAKLATIPRKSLTAIPVSGTKNPEIFEAETIDQLIEKIPQKFKVELRRTDGSSAEEVLSVNSMEDIELKNIIGNSETLKMQQNQRAFLSKLLNEITYNKNFKAELTDILNDKDRKAQLLNSLKEMQALLQENRPPILETLLKM